MNIFIIGQVCFFYTCRAYHPTRPYTNTHMNIKGNRVTVRDWFQLTLKEGLTVFRDQWFSSDATSAAVKRIEDVRGLRAGQFREDASPMSHPIRPESYISMDNFYTAIWAWVESQDSKSGVNSSV